MKLFVVLVPLYLLLFGPSYLPADVRITNIKAYDSGTISEDDTSTSAIDVVQDECDPENDGETVPEEFHDTLLGIDVVNDGNSTVRITKFSYTIRNPYGAGGRLKSRRLSPVGSGEIEVNADAQTISALFLKTSAGRKLFTGKSTAIPASLGFKNVTIRIEGETSNGREYVATSRTALSFGNFDRCED